MILKGLGENEREDNLGCLYSELVSQWRIRTLASHFYREAYFGTSIDFAAV